MGVLTSKLGMDNRTPARIGSMPTRSTPKQASEDMPENIFTAHASNDADTCCRMTTMHDMRLKS
jgi:hypothetical protein